jgi:hypothetical protein
MPSALEPQIQQLRTQIARSRRRLDRHARDLLSVPASLVSLARWFPRGRHRPWLVTLAAGFGLAHWLSSRTGQSDAQRPSAGQSVADWLERLARRLRVLAWQARRRAVTEMTASGTEEVSDE